MRGNRKNGRTGALLAARVREVLALRLGGAEFYDLAAHAAEACWNVSDRTLWRYVARADALLEESLERDRDKLLRRHVAQRRRLYSRAALDGDHRTALAVLRDEAELQGLYPARGVKLSGDPDNPLAVKVEALTDDERRAAVARILERYAAPGGAGGPLADRLEGRNGDGSVLGDARGDHG